MADSGKLLSAAELSAFCEQIALILKAGIPVQEGIAIMVEDNRNAKGVEILQQIQEQTELGASLRESLEKADAFPKYMLDMVAIGEQSGRLDEVMDALVLYYERSEAISKNLRSAVTYPILMIVMMLVVIGILIMKVLPIFAQVFEQLGSQLSPFSQGILHLGGLMNQYAVVILVVLGVIVLVLAGLRFTKGGAALYAKLFRSFPGTRKLAAKISAGRFASAMSMMLSSGLDVDQSLEMASALVDDSNIQSKIAVCQEHIAQGESFSDALTQTNIFSGVYSRMVSVGFKTGSVDGVMRKIADRCEAEVDDQIGSMISVLEPTLVAVLSLIVGMILLSVMLPLMGIMTSIG